MGTAEFAYNNKVHTGTKVLSLEANNDRNPRIGFEMRKKGRYKRAENFTERIKKIQEEAKVALAKVQENIEKYTDKHRPEAVEYKVRDLVLLSTKELKWQMKGQCSEKLTKRFVGLYKIKAIISSNAVELNLLATIKIHPVVGFVATPVK